MEILMILVTGLIVGVVAKFVMPGPDPGGLIITTLLGIAGASVGGFISQLRDGDDGRFLPLGCLTRPCKHSYQAEYDY